jgi:hypothetical protein
VIARKKILKIFVPIASKNLASGLCHAICYLTVLHYTELCLGSERVYDDDYANGSSALHIRECRRVPRPFHGTYHRLNMEVDLQSLFGLHVT